MQSDDRFSPHFFCGLDDTWNSTQIIGSKTEKKLSDCDMWSPLIRESNGKYITLYAEKGGTRGTAAHL